MLEVLTVCTGNVARSPLAEVLVRARTADLGIRVHSAGTRALIGHEMPAESIALAAANGGDETEARAHRGRLLTEGLLETPHLVLAMAREHRRAVVELNPRRLRSAFTAREFARLAAPATDASIRAAVDGSDDVSERMRLALAHIASMRGRVEPPSDPADDDVIDPFRRSERTYLLAASQLVPAVDEVARVLRVVTSG